MLNAQMNMGLHIYYMGVYPGFPFQDCAFSMDYMENFEIPELQVGLLSPKQDPFLPPVSP